VEYRANIYMYVATTMSLAPLLVSIALPVAEKVLEEARKKGWL